MTKTISGIVWQPCDKNAMPSTKVLCIDSFGDAMVGYLAFDDRDGSFWATNHDETMLLGVTHYAHITPLQLPDTETLEAEMKAAAVRHNAQYSITRVVFEQGFRAALEYVNKLINQ